MIKENTLLSISCTTSEDISTDPMLSNVALYSLPRLVPMVELSVPVISLVSKVLMKIISFLFSNQKELCIRAYKGDRVVVLGKG